MVYPSITGVDICQLLVVKFKSTFVYHSSIVYSFPAYTFYNNMLQYIHCYYYPETMRFLFMLCFLYDAIYCCDTGHKQL